MVNKAKILTVTSMSGGVGKTTFSMMLANIYSCLDRNVLLIDLDLYSGNLAFALGSNNKYSIYNLCDDIKNSKLEDMGRYISRVRDNISFISAPKDMRLASKVDLKAFNSALSILRYSYDVIIIDTNHTLSGVNMIAYENSDKILTLLSNDSYSLQNTKSFLTIVNHMKVDNVLLVMNYSHRLDLETYSNYDIKTILGRNIDYTIDRKLYLNNYNKLVIEEKVIDFDNNYSPSEFKYYQELADCMINILEEGKDEK